MHHVIIGAGPAGVVAAESLRKLDPESEISLIGEEPEAPYSRMALPYYLIKQIPEEGTHLRKDKNHFVSKKIKIVQDKVTKVEPDSHNLSLEKSGPVSYDKLLVATGSHAVSPPIPGMDLPGIHNCWTLEDGRNIAEKAIPGAKVVLMGAGFIGCIILEALAKSGAELTVVEMEDRMVPRMMNDIAGNMIKSWCIKQGVNVHTSTMVKAIEEGNSENPLRVVLNNGDAIEADLVVSATGVRSSIAFLEGSGINTDFGILIDRHMRSSVADIYAAGDVAQGKDFSTGEYTVQAIQPTATEHGVLAAKNMAGFKNAVHPGSVNMNVLDTLGLISSSFGLWMGATDGDSAELLNEERYRYMNLQFEEDVLVGATSLGLTQHVGVLRGLIQSKTRLGKWKEKLMEDPTQIMEAYLASTQAVGFNPRFG